MYVYTIVRVWMECSKHVDNEDLSAITFIDFNSSYICFFCFEKYEMLQWDGLE